MLLSTAIVALVAGNSFADDVAFLSKYTPTIVLKNAKGAAVVVAPAYQGRVMTSSARTNEPGNGWINYDLISSGKTLPHMTPFGGEDRLWLGPEGGQFSIYFKSGDPFDLPHWQVPPLLDTVPFWVERRSTQEVTVSRDATLRNYSDTPFQFNLSRTLRLLDDAAIRSSLGITPGQGLSTVAYESVNRLTNKGQRAWTQDTGLLSIWILGMLKHSPTTTVIAPIKSGPESALGRRVNDHYFGKVPANRLKTTDTHVFFRADGQFRSKIGFSPKRAMPVIGSYDPARGLLSIVRFSMPAAPNGYVNSSWELQENPFGGDVSNSYNDGPPPGGGKPLGPFYELESSSPALALKPGQTSVHTHKTFHFKGDRAALYAIAKKVLQVDLRPLESSNFWK